MTGGPVAQPGGFGGLGLGFRRRGPSLGLGLCRDGLSLLDAAAVGAGLLANAICLGPALLVTRTTRHEGERQDQQQDHHHCHDDQDDGVVHARLLRLVRRREIDAPAPAAGARVPRRSNRSGTTSGYLTVSVPDMFGWYLQTNG